MKKALVWLTLCLVVMATLSTGAESKERFVLSNLSWEMLDGDVSRVIGEIENGSGKSYESAIFTLSVYDDSGKLVDRLDFVVEDFQKGAVESFEAMGFKALPASPTFKIKLQMGM